MFVGVALNTNMDHRRSNSYSSWLRDQRTRTSIERLIVAFAGAVGISGLLLSPVRAQEASSAVEGHRFWGELGLGYGHLERSENSQTLRNDTFALNLAG